MSKKGHFFKRKATLKKRSYRQEIGIIRSNVKVWILKVIEWIRKLRGVNYGTN